jgi:hypothetical protein
VDLVREILASNESGISRDGLLAWARLRGDPAMTDAQLDAALAALGDEVVDDQGFLYLRGHAPAAALAAAEEAAPAWTTPTVPANAPPPPSAWTTPALSAAAADQPPSPPPPSADAWSQSDSWPSPDAQPALAPQPGSGRRMVVATIGVALFLVVAGIGVFLLGAADEGAGTGEPTPSTGTVVGTNDLGVGDCLVLPSEDQFDEVRRLACTEPHDAEIFFLGDHPDGDFPSSAEFETFVDGACTPAFETYTGSAYDEQDVLVYGWFTPTQSSWEGGDRGVLCYLEPADETRTDRSYRGANP